MKLSDEQLASELRAMRPKIDADFGAELDAWAAEGFPSVKQLDSGKDEPSSKRFAAEDEHRPRGSWLRARFRRFRERPLLPALAGAATIIIGVTVAVGLYQATRGESGSTSRSLLLETSARPESGRTSGNAGPASGNAGAQRESAPAGDAIAPATVPPVAPTDGQLKPGQPRIQERSASMTLSTDPDKVAEVADGVVEVTERYDGIVASSNVNTSSERGRASFDLRIPTQNLRAALADLSDLASVASRNEGTLDITAPFVRAEERFGDAKAEADALVTQLGEADSTDEIASIREQLRAARLELAAARSELASLKQRGDYSTVGITVVGDGDADGWSFGDAIDDAVSVIEDIGGASIVGLAVIVPLGILAAALWFGLRDVRRRTRESALDD